MVPILGSGETPDGKIWYAMPLARLAHLYARLAQGSHDARLGSAMGDLFDAMTKRPDMVSGEARKVTDGIDHGDESASLWWQSG